MCIACTSRAAKVVETLVSNALRNVKKCNAREEVLEKIIPSFQALPNSTLCSRRMHSMTHLRPFSIKEALRTFWCNASLYFALSIWTAGLLAAFGATAVTLIGLLSGSKWAVVSLAILIVLWTLPLDIRPPGIVKRWLRFVMVASGEYFPVSVIVEDREAFKEGTPYIVGYEPHSVLPQGITVFSHYANDHVPPALHNIRIMASSAGFTTAVMRHLWWWLGCRPVSKKVIHSFLSKGTSVALCPGGVRECLYMEQGKEVVFLKQRKGFVRIALQHGAPLVPVFAFGQTELYSYLRPFFDWPKGIVPRPVWMRFARRLGYAPFLMWGVMGTFIPKKVPMVIVVGRPIEVPKVEQPTDEEVEQYLQQFIAAIQVIWESHREKLGYKTTELVIY